MNAPWSLERASHRDAGAAAEADHLAHRAVDLDQLFGGRSRFQMETVGILRDDGANVSSAMLDVCDRDAVEACREIRER